MSLNTWERDALQNSTGGGGRVAKSGFALIFAKEISDQGNNNRRGTASRSLTEYLIKRNE